MSNAAAHVGGGPATKRTSGVRCSENPFPGLRPFGANESHLFFGRESHIERLLGKLTQQRLLAVVGTSGSGKSSLVLAGALPRLARGYKVDGRSWWRVVEMRPGDDPLGQLAWALVRLRRQEEPGCDTVYSELSAENVADPAPISGEQAPPSFDDEIELEQRLLRAQLRRSRLGLIDAVRELDLDAGENLLLVVDQFEELFRYRELAMKSGGPEDAATSFVQLLLEASTQNALPIYIMLTMRSDFLGECVQFNGLPEAINDGQYLVPLLTRDERERTIRGPIGVAGGAVAPQLVQRLLNDTGEAGDQLPVLQHVLMRTFELWQLDPEGKNELDIDHYRRAGEMDKALSEHADLAYEEVRAMGERAMFVAERLFRSLTDSREGRGVRRPCRAREILEVAGTDFETLSAVVDCFAREGRGFLVIRPEGTLQLDSTLDISHESLMRCWRRLQRWTARERELARQLTELDEAATAFARNKDSLWRDPKLALTLAWRQREQPTAAHAARYGVNWDAAMGFLDQSLAAREREWREKAESEAAREANARKRALQSRLTVIVLAVLTLVSTASAIWAVSAHHQAQAALAYAEWLRLNQKELTERLERALARTANSSPALSSPEENAAFVESGEIAEQQEALMPIENAPVSNAVSQRSAYEMWKEGYDLTTNDDPSDDGTAKKLYEEAINRTPSYAPPYNSIGRYYYDKKQYEQAVDWFEKAIARQANYAPAHYNLASVAYLRKDYELACQRCLLALQHRPGYALAVRLQKSIERASGVPCKASRR